MSFPLSLRVDALLPVLLGVTLTRFLAMGHYALQRKVYPGFKTLVFTELLGLGSLFASILRANIGDTAAIVFTTNFLLLAHATLVYHGFGAYVRAPRLATGTRRWLGFCLVVSLLQACDVIFAPDMSRRVIVYSLAMTVLHLRVGVGLLWRARRPLPGLRLVCFSYFVTAGLGVLRLAYALGGYELTYAEMLRADTLLAAFVLVRILQSVLELYAAFTMNSAMLEDELKLATAQIEHMAHTDSLTGVLNRRGLDLAGPEALRRSCGADAPTAVLMLDLDHFKRVNDTLGHAAGDELLRGVARLWTGQLRREDVFARYGGEEFVVVAPMTAEQEALALAERMRQAAAQAHFPALGGRRITVSVGVTGGRCDSLEALLKSADAALYEAKQTGRDKVCVAAPGVEEGENGRLARG
ncbi:MAG: hypothetical protein AUJ49_03530 [Desulfovibrionaceae bacterium CG1_02_65_16]|nr:MAG: hypothetical protein AUJ49_03530 [Desulfovibrionaceae bacterium CG1_02_65_16]